MSTEPEAPVKMTVSASLARARNRARAFKDFN